MRLHPAIKNGERKVIAVPQPDPVDPDRRPGARGAVRQGAAPGDFLGTEKDLAERFGVSRIVARDALRTLEAQGIVEIKVGAGGGARIAQGNARLFAEALAVQLDLAGVSAAEIMDAQRAIECLAAELAAINATAEDHARLRELIADAERKIDDVAAYHALVPRVPSRGGGGLAQPRAGRAAHLAAARLLAGAAIRR